MLAARQAFITLLALLIEPCNNQGALLLAQMSQWQKTGMENEKKGKKERKNFVFLQRCPCVWTEQYDIGGEGPSANALHPLSSLFASCFCILIISLSPPSFSPPLISLLPYRFTLIQGCRQTLISLTLVETDRDFPHTCLHRHFPNSSHTPPSPLSLPHLWRLTQVWRFCCCCSENHTLLSITRFRKLSGFWVICSTNPYPHTGIMWL